MTSNSGLIRSDRLDLVLLQMDALQHSLAEDIIALQHHLGVDVPLDWLEAKGLVKLRYEQIIHNPDYAPWSIRAITLREKRVMIGYIGFHTKPGASYLESFAPNGVEFGYTIFPAFRRNGYAREAVIALMKWSYEEYSVPEFVLSISPDNIPSLKLAHGLGFAKIGSQVDEEDGVEDIFKLDYQQLNSA